MENENVIEIKNLSKSYSDFKLEDVSFNVKKGCVTGFIGQNGAGKSTTIKSILNVIKRDSGNISVFGLDNIKNENEIKDKIGVVYDDLLFHDTLNAYEIGKMLKYIYSEWNMEEYNRLLSEFAVPLKKKCKDYSRGMRMKLQIATALSHNAKLLIMDEPTSGLDPVVRNEILDVFMEYVQNEEHTILLSSHIITDLERIADYITFIDRGKVLLSDDKYSILEKHGIIRCKNEEAKTIEDADIVSKRQSEFGTEILVSDREKIKKRYSSLLVEEASLEDIMIFYTKRR